MLRVQFIRACSDGRLFARLGESKACQVGSLLLGNSDTCWASFHRFGHFLGLGRGVSSPLLVVVGVERPWLFVYWGGSAFACHHCHWFRSPTCNLGFALRQQLAVSIHWNCDGAFPTTVG